MRTLEEGSDDAGELVIHSALFVAAALLGQVAVEPTLTDAPRAASLELPALIDAPRAATLELPARPGGTALMIAAQTGLLLGSGGVSYLVGSSWAIADFNANGRPDPQMLAASIAVSMAINLAITWLVLPELSRLSDDEKAEVDVTAIRLQVWKTTRWIALAGAVFAGIFAAGAISEHGQFGRGQIAMMIGIAGAGTSLVTFDIAAVLAGRQALSANRHPAEDDK